MSDVLSKRHVERSTAPHVLLTGASALRNSSITTAPSVRSRSMAGFGP